MAKTTIPLEQFQADFGVLPTSREAFNDQQLMSVFGTPILGAVKIDHLLLDNCMFTLTGSNHIITTDVAFVQGTVNEFYGQNDYEISLRGYLIGNDYQEALQMAYELDRLCKQKSGHEINNGLMKEMQIDRCVIKRWTIDADEGGEHYFKFKIQARSERRIELNIKEL